MKKVLEPVKPEKVQYICDLCGKEIEQTTFQTEIVTILFNEVRGNGWNEYPVRVECHAHRKCLQTAIEVMKKQREEINCDF